MRATSCEKRPRNSRRPPGSLPPVHIEPDTLPVLCPRNERNSSPKGPRNNRRRTFEPDDATRLKNEESRVASSGMSLIECCCYSGLERGEGSMQLRHISPR